MLASFLRIQQQKIFYFLAKRSKCAVSIEGIKDVWTYMMLFLLQ
jgi:hypothetical protein